MLHSVYLPHGIYCANSMGKPFLKICTGFTDILCECVRCTRSNGELVIFRSLFAYFIVINQDVIFRWSISWLFSQEYATFFPCHSLRETSFFTRKKKSVPDLPVEETIITLKNSWKGKSSTASFQLNYLIHNPKTWEVSYILAVPCHRGKSLKRQSNVRQAAQRLISTD